MHGQLTVGKSWTDSEQVNTEYKSCLDAGKTERECVTLAVEKAKAEGYKEYQKMSLKTVEK